MGILSDHFSGIDECDKIKVDSFDGMFTEQHLESSGHKCIKRADNLSVYIKSEENENNSSRS